MDRISLDSTTLRSAGYDPATHVMELEFCTGAIYRYYGVPEFIFCEFLAADSKGRFFGRVIRDRFSCVLIARAASG